MNSREKAREAALKKLGSRARTEKEIRDHLRSLDFSTEDVNDAVDFLREYNYINDERYCRQYYAYARPKGKALYRIIRELEQKGIPAHVARTALEDMEAEPEFGEEVISDRDAALEVGFKMARQQSASGKDFDQKFLARIGRRLAGLGYDSSTCYYVMNKVKDYGKEDE
ncbi:MAG: regulatory protein RecX [Firmicutes bacterium]|nr:regulatory protein RecX [Bacillota bacterium]